MYCAVSCILGIYEPFQQTGQGNDLAGILNPKSSAGRGVRMRQKEQRTGHGPYRNNSHSIEGKGDTINTAEDSTLAGQRT